MKKNRKMKTLKEINEAGYKFVATDNNEKVVACSGGVYLTNAIDALGRVVTVYTTEEVK